VIARPEVVGHLLLRLVIRQPLIDRLSGNDFP
jgi:hypothetical protein